ISMKAREPIEDAVVNVFLHDEHEHLVYHCEGSALVGQTIDLLPGRTESLQFRLVANLLPGTYWLGTEIRGRASDGGHRRLVDWQPRRLPVTVVGTSEATGTANLFATCQWKDMAKGRLTPRQVPCVKEA
ncbi:MAG: hypothetical protein U1D30_05185, partial [Planctomycetota bacterium]